MAYDKVVDSAALDVIFKSIADAIRTKAGTTEAIEHTAMAAAIRAIKGGGFPNGTAWTQSNITSGLFGCVHNANGIWVAGGTGNASTGLYYSTNGKTWTQSNITSGKFTSVYNANGIWVACTDGNGLYYSTDGKTWTQSNLTSAYCNAVYNANGLWVACSSTGIY